ncbi:MAG: hypothetical protein ABSA93_10350 [Streptosporangiaceae bacterium]
MSDLASCRTASADGAGAPRLTATASAVVASVTSSSPTTAGHRADARRLTAAGSDITRWNSARRSEIARYVRRRMRARCPGGGALSLTTGNVPETDGSDSDSSKYAATARIVEASFPGRWACQLIGHGR